MTRGEAAAAAFQDSQDGACMSQPQRTPRGQDKKMEQGGKSNKPPKHKDQYRDMLYYTQKLAGPADSSQATAQHSAIPTEKADRDTADRLDDPEPMESVPDPMPDLFDAHLEDSPQPTLSKILHAVHKCTASVNDLKEKFGGTRGDGVSPPPGSSEDQGKDHCCGRQG